MRIIRQGCKAWSHFKPKECGSGMLQPAQHSTLPHQLDLISLTGVFHNVSPTQTLFKGAEVVVIVFNKQGYKAALQDWFQGSAAVSGCI